MFLINATEACILGRSLQVSFLDTLEFAFDVVPTFFKKQFTFDVHIFKAMLSVSIEQGGMEWIFSALRLFVLSKNWALLDSMAVHVV